MKIETKVQLNVTKDHIQRGVKEDCINCAIAISLRETIPDSTIGVYKHCITSDIYGVAMHDKELAHWIDAFDNREEVAPISREITFIKYRP